MYLFSNDRIAIASTKDTDEIRLLLNSAYRGDTSKKGWTTEADLIQGEVRTDEASLLKVMNQPGSVFLKYTDDAQHIIACVNLQKQDRKVYLGMFSVSPLLQGGGIGKKLLQAAEEYAHQINGIAIYMSVISVRTELIDWYKRYGYVDTGKRIAFEEDNVSGRHVKKLEFMVLEKAL
ncbi:MAG: GNAT family N-acetyltransferase [Agriterribacter sp.]